LSFKPGDYFFHSLPCFIRNGCPYRQFFCKGDSQRFLPILLHNVLVSSGKQRRIKCCFSLHTFQKINHSSALSNTTPQNKINRCSLPLATSPWSNRRSSTRRFQTK